MFTDKTLIQCLSITGVYIFFILLHAPLCPNNYINPTEGGGVSTEKGQDLTKSAIQSI